VVPLAVSAVLACRMLVATTLIPPWQQPDENSHVAQVELARTRITGSGYSPDPAREAEILRSMSGYDFWEHRARGFPIPAVIPESFTAAGARVGTPAGGGLTPPAYFPAAGRLLSWLPRLSVVQDMYILRGISAIFGMLTLWVAWLAAREGLGPFGGATVAMLLALHPQFAIVSTAATPDAVANLFGACLWWMAVAAVMRQRYLWPLAGVWLAAGAAAAADRMGVPLLAVALSVSVVVLRLHARDRGWLSRTRTLGMLLLAAVVFGASIWLLFASGVSYGLQSIFSGSLAPVPEARTWEYFARFTSFLHQSWWASLGWGRYPPPSWWIGTTIALTAMAAVGAAWSVFRGRTIDGRTRVILGLAAVSLTIQVAAVYWVYFRLAVGPQGKSLFPVLVPSLMLLWAGLTAWIPETRRAHAAVALVAAFAVLDAAIWGLVAIPAYYASL